MEPQESANKAINASDAEFAKVGMDPCGRIFSWQGRIFRAIHHNMVQDVQAMFSCGMIGKLAEEKLFPASQVTDYVMDGYGLVIEHERITNLTYPFEWSFGMLKDAALTVLKANLVAGRFGYETKDCHPFNVCFNESNPFFVDLGSFIPVITKGSWACYEEFLKSYYYPLCLWSHGNSFMARRLLCSLALTEAMPHESYLLYKYPLLRALNLDHLRGAVRYWFALKKRLVGGSFNFDKLIDSIGAISIKKSATKWGNYHDAYHDQNGAPVSSPRFSRIIELINGYGIEKVVELGGNQGIFSELLLKDGQVRLVVCTDCDENAVDIMYTKAREKRLHLTTAVIDIMYPLMNYYEAPPYDRFQSDAVVVLAVTHHLVLGQHLPIDLFFEIVSKYSSKYVFIEFMPLGLWDGKTAAPLPEWYSQEWFQAAFEKFFKLLLVEELEENRVLFVGELPV